MGTMGLTDWLLTEESVGLIKEKETQGRIGLGRHQTGSVHTAHTVRYKENRSWRPDVRSHAGRSAKHDRALGTCTPIPVRPSVFVCVVCLISLGLTAVPFFKHMSDSQTLALSL
jgi:hypothetical protein